MTSIWQKETKKVCHTNNPAIGRLRSFGDNNCAEKMSREERDTGTASGLLIRKREVHYWELVLVALVALLGAGPV